MYERESIKMLLNLIDQLELDFPTNILKHTVVCKLHTKGIESSRNIHTDIELIKNC